MTQMAVRAMCFIRGIVVMPAADDERREDKQRQQRQRNSEYANYFWHIHADGEIVRTASIVLNGDASMMTVNHTLI